MHPKVLVELACELLGELLTFESPADAVVSSHLRRHRQMGSRERHTLAETSYTALRRLRRLRHLAGDERKPEAWRRPDPRVVRRIVLLAWAGDGAFLQAALAPEEREWLAQASAAVVSPDLPVPLRHNLPDWLADRLLASLGEEAFWALVNAMEHTAPLDLRVNLLKAKRDEVRDSLAAQGLHTEPTPWSPWGLRAQGRPALQRSPEFLEGRVEVQDEGSQLLALLTEARRGEMVVDFCAGAGGKTLALGAMMRSTGRLYAFDTSGHRLDAMKPRMARSGLSSVHPAQIAHERDERIKRLSGKIDRVLVDAPCSGLGTLRRNPDLKWRQGEAAVAEMVLRQRAILASAARLVKPGAARLRHLQPAGR